MRKSILSFFFSFVILSSSLFAQTNESPFVAKFLIEGGIEYGGDEILEVLFTTGGSQTILAGQGGYVAVGGEFKHANISALMLRATLGIKYNTTAADNANIRLTRIPINLVAYYKPTDDIRIGVGAATHPNGRFKGDGFVEDVDFTSSIGPRFEVGYKWIALTYTSVNYMNESNEKVGAGSIGLSLSMTLPKE